MWKQISLRVRIYIILAILVLITLSGGLVMIWYTYRIETLLTRVIDKNAAAFQVSMAVENSLERQKGLLSYYFIDGDPRWLRQLGEYREIFNRRLNEAHSLAGTKEQQQTIDLIESEYKKYISSKDRVIAYYKFGERQSGAMLHEKVRKRFFIILNLCKQYKDFYKKNLKEVIDKSGIQALRLRIIAVTAMASVLCLALFLAVVLARHILDPLRRLALETDREGSSHVSVDEVKALSHSVHGLIEDYDHTHFELIKSREHLLEAEKMALVGKLAAGMAHSIRNPLTSVKMRLFSLDRTLDLSPTQEDDFEVISEEMLHIDKIVENFLEFSRPPKLRMQKINPSDVVDLAIQLLRHRLESYDVKIVLNRHQPLPKIKGDPEQLKEVLVNLIVNSCEAMEGGGSIAIHEEKGFAEPLGQVLILRLTDNGPGIPGPLREKIFQPFFTTKEEGTGLGLSIAARIIENHGGWLESISNEGDGATFVITLPVEEPDLEQHSNN